MASGEMSDEAFAEFTQAWMRLAGGVVVDGGLLATFIDWRGVETVLAAGRGLGFELLNLIVWSKTNAGMGSLWRSQHELLPVFKLGDGPLVNNVDLGRHGRWRSNVWTAPGASSLGSDARKGLMEHPTVKPAALLEEALLDVTLRGEGVLDCFMGSGSTLLATEATGRTCYGIELDERYVDVAVRRWQIASGKDAVLDETGESFAEAAARRSVARRPEQKRLPRPAPRLLAAPDRGVQQ